MAIAIGVYPRDRFFTDGKTGREAIVGAHPLIAHEPWIAVGIGATAPLSDITARRGQRCTISPVAHADGLAHTDPRRKAIVGPDVRVTNET
jgi:hypothetical protein